MNTASIIIDIWNVRCGDCKVAVRDHLATNCPVCGATFDRIVSNHAGLAAKLERERDAAHIENCHARIVDSAA